MLQNNEQSHEDLERNSRNTIKTEFVSICSSLEHSNGVNESTVRSNNLSEQDAGDSSVITKPLFGKSTTDSNDLSEQDAGDLSISSKPPFMESITDSNDLSRLEARDLKFNSVKNPLEHSKFYDNDTLEQNDGGLLKNSSKKPLRSVLSDMTGLRFTNKERFLCGDNGEAENIHTSNIQLSCNSLRSNGLSRSSSYQPERYGGLSHFGSFQSLGRTVSDGVLKSSRQKFSLKKQCLLIPGLMRLDNASLRSPSEYNLRRRRSGISTCSSSHLFQRSRGDSRHAHHKHPLKQQGRARGESVNDVSCNSSTTNESPMPGECKPHTRQHVGSQSMRRNNADRNDRIIVNVGGTCHETFRSTLKHYPDTRLGWIALNRSECIDAYDPVLNEYFFDRHPTAFTQIINFYRTGKLHAPADICGPLFQEELQYWGLDEKSMEPCCWSKYTEHRDAQENLKVFDTPLLNSLEEELNIETMYDQQASKEDDSDAGWLRRLFKQLKPPMFNSMQWFRIKKKIWIAFEDRSPTRPMLPKVLGIVSLMFIVMSVMSLFFHSMLLLEPNSLYELLLCIMDISTFTWFIIEFVLRFVSSPKRSAFIMSITNIVDLICIVTYPIQFSYGFQYYRERNEPIEVLAAFRLFRLFRFLRLSLGLQILKHALIASSKELFLLILLLIIPVAIFATLTYYIERKVTDTKFKTIPESIWWAIITITTVGYGDMSPLTSFGKAVGAACAICGVVILSLPVSIIGNNFSLFYHYAQARMKLPKRPKVALAGAANIFVAEQSQQSSSSDESENEGEAKMNLPQINFGSNPDFNANITSKRFRRERLSLYATTNHRQTSRRSRSVGITGAESRQRQRNGHGPKTTANYSDADSKSDSDSEYEEVFKPIAQQTTTASPTTKSSAMSYENQAFNPETPTEVDIDGDGEEKESTAVTALSNCNYSNSKDNIEDGGSDDQPMSTTTIQTCVSILETIVTDSETGTNQNLSNGDHHSQLGLIKNAHYKKFSSPPVLRRNNSTGNGGGHSNKKISSSKIPPSTLAPTKTKNNGLTTTTIDILSANEMSPEHILENKRRRSNNHLYPPHSDGIT